MQSEITTIAGTVSTTIFALSNIPMLIKAGRTKSLRSYSYTYIIMNNGANSLHWIYILSLPVGPIYVLHAFYTLAALLLLIWYRRYEGSKWRIAKNEK
jgi:uncharacterized protein with PQ loop repeat